MKKIILCNTSYQLFVATWMKLNILRNEKVDIVLSDHTVGFDIVSKNIDETGLFDKVYYVKTKVFCKSGEKKHEKIKLMISPNSVLSKYIVLEDYYDAVYMANFENFSMLVFHTIANDLLFKYRNKNIKAYLFEDGASTFCTSYEQWHKYTDVKYRWSFSRKKTIYKNTKGMYVFDKQGFLWTPEIPITTLPKVKCECTEFKNYINQFFGYENMVDVYDKKYLFMEESFFADKYEVNDIQIVQKLADMFGKDNVMIKIHPRNPENRFEKMGFKTNKDTFIPWEAIILNQNIGDKVMYTISSSSVLNPARIFDVFPEVHLLHEDIDEIPPSLSNGLLDVVKKTYSFYYGDR